MVLDLIVADGVVRGGDGSGASIVPVGGGPGRGGGSGGVVRCSVLGRGGAWWVEVGSL